MASEKKTTDNEMNAVSPKDGIELPAIREDARCAAPPVDIYETEAGLMVLVDMPGVEIDEVDIRVEDDRLTIKGRTSHVPGDTRSLHREFQPVNFFRQFELGSEVDLAGISAGARDGVLTINLPRAEKVKPRRIDVKVA